ncbi:SipW-dependent-type signal peptide-containing protein [Rossellomorea aquimaris]|uniref:SipW-dependent-type signal peptide-containing protein n=1 Tax=Rossellomorea aquimaris TaxID=189382 RepID=UPI0005CB543B|nr:SipW-dependent-type signal peptide-containing protein [Rossellomorea aquimaris]
MKSTKFIAGALVAGMMLTGAGYAYWTDQVAISNTVSTGEMKVEFDEEFIFPGIIDIDTAGENRYVDSKITHGAKTTSVEIKNMYPGAMSLFAAKVENKGSIPAVLDNVDITSTQSSAILDTNLLAAGGYIHLDKNNNLKGGDYFIGTLGSLESDLNDMLDSVRLEPGDYILFDIPEEYKDEVAAAIPAYNPEEQNCIIFYLNHNAGDDAELQTAEFDIDLNWKQHNDQ